MWLSVNPKVEREAIAQAAMALSGWYKQGWSEDGETLHTIPLTCQLEPSELAALYNNADSLELDIYAVPDGDVLTGFPPETGGVK